MLSYMFVLQERRLAAVKELVRLLKPGGRALIYVWAFEQEYNKQKSKYLKDQSKEHHGKHSPLKNISGNGQEPHERICTSGGLEGNIRSVDTSRDVSKVTDGRLGMHTNRTAFNTQDVLVPWHLKEEKKQGEEESETRKTSKKNSSYSCSVSSLSPTVGSRPDTSLATHSAGSESSSSNSAPTPASTLKSESSPAPVFHRYYHVFQQGELEQLCGQVAGVKVQSSYHDQGNWCVILEKD